MDAKLLIKARIQELDQELNEVVDQLKSMRGAEVDVSQVDAKAKQVLTLKAGRAELQNVLEKL